MSNYVIKRSDPANGSFLVQSDQIDGTSRPWNAALYVNSVSGLAALSSNSSLVLAGRGITDYGELVQNNLVYLMEHFAYKTRPLTPMQGQIWYKNADFVDPSNPSDPASAGLYVWSGTAWQPILAANVFGTVDFGGARLSNLGNAVAGTDALNRNTADLRYIPSTGGTVSGAMTFGSNVTLTSGVFTVSGASSAVFALGVPVTINNSPTVGTHAANKAYVDAQDATVSGLVTAEATTRATQDGILAGDIATINGQLANFVQVTGDTMTGNLTLDQNASLTVIAGGTGQINVGSRKIQQLGAPTLNTDATTKLYVDTAITTAIASLPSSSVADGVVSGGSFNSGTGVITLTRTLGLPNITITGNVAPFSHTHTSTNITYDLATLYSQSYLTLSELSTPGYPTIPLYYAVKTLDQTVADLSRRFRRKLLNGDGTTVTFALGTPMTYSVGEHKMQVFMNGVKQYCDDRGRSVITFTGAPINPRSPIGIAAGTYTFTINVNGGGVTTVTIVVTAGMTFLQLFLALDAAFSTLTLPISINMDQFYDRLEFSIETNGTGSGKSLVVSYAVGELFTLIPTSSAPVNTSVSTNLQYFEVGNPGDDSASITFHAAPPNGSMIEVLLYPG